jgi:hypothetical protein
MVALRPIRPIALNWTPSWSYIHSAVEVHTPTHCRINIEHLGPACLYRYFFLGRCLSGFTGDACETEVSQTSDDLLRIVVPVAIVSGLLFILLIGYCCWMCIRSARRKKWNLEKQDETMSSSYVLTLSITLTMALYKIKNGVRVMVFNATFNNISVISWRSVLLVEETGVPGENHRPIPNQTNFIT